MVITNAGKGAVNMGEVRSSAIYSEKDYEDISRQINKRWSVVAFPCAILLVAMVWSLTVRLEWITSGSTVLIGLILIASYDLAIKPLMCYKRHLDSVLHGRTRETTLPFVSISEDVSLVGGVNCRALTCRDVDGKGRPYDRLFYFDCMKEFPDYQEGEVLRIVHHDLLVADVQRA